MPLHKRIHAGHHPQQTGDAPNWRSRLVVLGVMTLALSIYVAGIFWFGQGLAEDMRAGVREVHSGVLIPDMER